MEARVTGTVLEGEILAELAVTELASPNATGNEKSDEEVTSRKAIIKMRMRESGRTGVCIFRSSSFKCQKFTPEEFPLGRS